MNKIQLLVERRKLLEAIEAETDFTYALELKQELRDVEELLEAFNHAG